MINTSDVIIWTGKGTTNRAIAALKDLEHLTSSQAKYNGKPVDEITCPQTRTRIALCIFLQKTDIQRLQKSDFNLLYTITTTSKTDNIYLKQLYERITGSYPKFIEDVEGLRSPLRAWFAILWSEGILTLPHTFCMDGAWQKYPELMEVSQGFVYNMTKSSPSIARAGRAFQYRTTWHNLSDISFSELWEAAPRVVDAQKDIKNSGNMKSADFSYLSFLNIVSKQHPGIISPDQYFHLEKYHQHLQQKPKKTTALENAQSFESFKEMWGVDSEAWKFMTPKEREHYRYQNRTSELHTTYKQAHKARGMEAKRAMVAEAHKNSTPEELAVITRNSIGRTLSDLAWLTDSAYPGLEHLDLKKLSSHWRAAIALLTNRLNINKIHGRARSNYFREVSLLMDYIFCNLPIWQQMNSNSLISIPCTLTEFYRTLFWNNDYVDTDMITASILPPSSNGSGLPITVIEFYLLCYSKKTAASFISTIHLLFELAIAQGKDVYIDRERLNDGSLTNPVFPKLDSPGSGGRTKTDKVVLPLASVPIAKEYMLAIDIIGTSIQQKVLNGEVSIEVQDKIRKADWIDLAELGISYSIKLFNPHTNELQLEIPLKRITNAYHWHHGRYDNGLAWVPWLSALRMLTVAMYGGLRLQNCQWLDIRSFNNFYHPERTVLGYTTLYVNTDKNGDSRPVSLPTEVFERLLKEREFQNSWTRRPVGPIYYENNPNDNKYAPIHPLFRSPFSKVGLPFSDTAYSQRWVKILNGIDAVYNSLVPKERQHSFTKTNKAGVSLAVHTPHALRATWITYMSIYGHLPQAILGQQVAHANIKSSIYYNTPPTQQTEEHIRAAETKAHQASWDSLWNAHAAPKAQNSLMTAWRDDPNEAAKTFGLVSLNSPVVDIESAGLSLLKLKDITEIGWYQVCACMANGKCPWELLKFTTSAKTCGMCPHAVFGVNHLPAINAKMRSLIDDCEMLQEQINATAIVHTGSQAMEDLHHQLTVSKLELAGFEQVRQILNQHTESNDYRHKYISRHGDLRDRCLEFDNEDPAQRFLANIIDGREFPAFAANNYLIRLKKIASQPQLLSIALSSPDERQIIANQIIFMLDNTGITIPELANHMREHSLLAIGSAT
ncbi:hypothetical protein PSE10B_46320 [Pseudomonas amygdali pv. eriobotryae]|uniref:site-specific integrase n=1 Tax=Pseudomonas amygdali TaxID=47877 RepID=UPI00167832C7|nr:site-specific integrase [Pseudomonas amygdali]GFZ68110.1 hypothetical protein PSE10B_46320 [Pseudomonas amygdali pv. eriobotryae]